MLTQTASRQFERDYVKPFKRHKELSKLKAVMRLIVEEKPIERKHRNHPLTGNWSAHRDCHIEPDWVLIYKIDQIHVWFERTGAHPDLFG